jgi:predicted amidohydrolase YtcJ
MAARLTAYLVVFIVGATFIAGLIVGAQRDDNDGPVDLIVHNAVVFTGESDGRKAEAVAVRANQVLKVGSNREILRLQRPQTIMVDARGGAVLPGFNDAHVHLIEGGLQLAGADLTGAASVEEAVERVAAWAKAHPEATWIVGRGWTEFAEGEPQPTRQALDAAVADRPVYLLSEDGAEAWVNTRALKAARIVRRTADPDAGRIVKDGRGEPTGILEGTATRLVASSLPKPTQDDRMRALLAALGEAQRLGITSVQASVDGVADLALFETAISGGATDMRVYPVLEFDVPRNDDEIARLDPVLAEHADDPFLKSGAIEVELDGVAPDPLNRLVRLLDERGWQVSIEADGPAETALAKTAFAHAARSNPRVPRARRHRLEHQHGQFTQVGATLALGSNWPAGPLAPMRVLEAALARVSLNDAVAAYSRGSAFASYDEQRKGTLEAGMLADIVVLSANIFEIEPALLGTVKVAHTIFDGRIVYSAERRLTIP